MIKDIKARISCDPKGKITTGKKSEKGYPQSTDYFVIEEFPELVAAYGTQPKKLVLFFPSDNIEDFFDCNYVNYGKETKIRQCDGVTCIHRINEEIAGQSFTAGQESDCVCKELPEYITKNDKQVKNPKRCSYVAYMKAWVYVNGASRNVELSEQRKFYEQLEEKLKLIETNNYTI